MELPEYLTIRDGQIVDRRVVQLQANGEYQLVDPVTHVKYDMKTGEKLPK